MFRYWILAFAIFMLGGFTHQACTEGFFKTHFFLSILGGFLVLIDSQWGRR